MFSYMGIAVISDRFFYFVSVVLFSATQSQTSGLFWQLFLHPLLKPQSAQHTLPRLRSQLKILHFLAFDFPIFFHPFYFSLSSHSMQNSLALHISHSLISMYSQVKFASFTIATLSFGSNQSITVFPSL